MKYIKFLSLILGLMWMSPLSYGALVSGEGAPDFTLSDTQGKSHSLSDYKGKHVVLEWINHDCPFVKKHYKNGDMQELQKAYTGKDVVWFSVASSAPGKQGHYEPAVWDGLTAQKGAAPTAVLLDPDGKVGKLYGAKTTPHMYVINPEGTLVYQGAIDSNPSADPADVKSADNYVQQVLDAVLAGEQVPVDAVKSYGCSVKYAD